MKFLNLDKFSNTTGRFLTIDGVNHEIKAIGTGQFIDTNVNIKQALNQEVDLAEQLKFMLDFICMLVPNAPREKLAVYTPEQLTIVTNFVRGEDVAEAEVVEDEPGK